MKCLNKGVQLAMHACSNSNDKQTKECTHKYREREREKKN